jgi:hypothetical protein
MTEKYPRQLPLTHPSETNGLGIITTVITAIGVALALR